mgnify:CR=1 FL=1
MNKVILIGNLVKDPEITTTNSGVSVCRFSLAVQRRFANADNGPQADFFNIVVWRGQAENCHKFLKKGSKCSVIGRIQNSSYEASDGTKRYVTEIVAEEVEFLSSRNSDGADAPKPTSSPKPDTAELEPIDDDSLPF